MKIAVITSWFSESMGYSENFFPKALATLGHDVHVITSTAQVYYNSPTYEKTYYNHLGPSIVKPCVKSVDGFMLHRLNFTEVKRHPLSLLGFRGIKINNLKEYLHHLQPDVVQVVNLIDEPVTVAAAEYAIEYNKNLFTESHLHASVIRTKNKKSLKEYLRSSVYALHPQIRLINKVTSLCYPIAQDAAEIVETLYHVPKLKIKIQPLGVDTDLFCPANSSELKNERDLLRASLGFTNDDLVCIYTGRFSRGKNPQTLADAVNLLQQRGEQVKALFLGNGTVQEVEEIRTKHGCIIHPFVYVRELPKYYRCADIGVWPREESTSQLDAIACGLPIIVSDQIHVTERLTGNGFLYEEKNVNDLAEKILMMKSEELRTRFSKHGINKIIRDYSWVRLAGDRVKDYKKYMNDYGTSSKPHQKRTI